MFHGGIHLCNVGYKICFKIPALSSSCKARLNVSDWWRDFGGLEMGLNELFARLRPCPKWHTTDLWTSSESTLRWRHVVQTYRALSASPRGCIERYFWDRLDRHAGNRKTVWLLLWTEAPDSGKYAAYHCCVYIWLSKALTFCSIYLMNHNAIVLFSSLLLAYVWDINHWSMIIMFV